MARYPAESQAPAVIVLTRFLIVTLILGTLTRLATKWWKFRTFFRDDYYILLAMVASIAEAVAISVAVDKGYGTHIHQLSDSQIAGILKAQYAANFFYILGIAFSQLSFLFFVKHLAHQSYRVFTVLQIILAIIAITGIFGSAFQCHPQQWDYVHDRCFNRKAWFTYLAMSMILVEIAIIVQTVIVMINVQTTWKKKANLTSVFLFRVLPFRTTKANIVGSILVRVPATLISHIILVHSTIDSADPTSTTWSLTIATQIALCLSVVTASTPQFVPVLRQLQTTGMRLDGMTRHTLSSNAQYSNSRSRSKYFISGQRTRDDSIVELDNMKVPVAMTETTVTCTHGQNGQGLVEDDHDDESQSSQANIIRETRTWVITEELVGGQH